MPRTFVPLLLIAASTAQAQGRSLEVNGGQLWYEECGAPTAPAVVLLHDGMVHSVTWNGIWAPLCERYHVVRYDRRGFGQSAPSKGPFTPEDDLVQVMR